ncbi:GNAT family N-acetyltransferase [Pelagimonas varians]|uniref:Acetyltransferase (GNAT) family protein n=1 Tax=Pelagimonas varians TaxID=696760 RepID=A0A238L5H6_9RHOB|nr:putative N-acetyltransferase YhbS [Pelagimonas varians]SMX49642.1 Acetyltransferase (GNAT) family protein [Pelagimonas varians]
MSCYAALHPNARETDLFTLYPERPEDWWEVEALYDTCFAPGRTALSSYRLREDVLPVSGLCVVARDEAGILGAAIRYWPVLVGGAEVLLLGPIAVHPTAQGEGLGSSLIIDTLERASEAGHDRVLLVGDAPYYRRFGFNPLQGVIMPPPTNPERVLGASLTPQAWAGIKGTVERKA